MVDVARQVLRDQVGSFVPAHPIAGKESAGIDHADASLYAGRQVILTPIERTLTAQLQKASAVWTALGAQVLKMSPEAHDATYAAVSHLPHLPGVCLHEQHRVPAQSRRAAVPRRPGLPRLHPHCRQRPARMARHLAGNRDEVARQCAAFRASLQVLETQIANGQATELEAAIARHAMRAAAGNCLACNPPPEFAEPPAR